MKNDPEDYFWLLLRFDVAKIAEVYQNFATIRARDAKRIAKALGVAAQHAMDVSPSKRRYLLILGVNNCYFVGPDGMWEELFDDGDIEF